MMGTTPEQDFITDEYNESKKFRAEWERLQKQDYLIKEVVENFEEKDRFIEAELKNLKEAFSKAKFNFLELETKEGFLKRLCEDSHLLEKIRLENIKDLERSVDERKNLVKNKKQEYEASKSGVADLVDSLCNEYNLAQERTKEVGQLIDEIEKMENEIITLRTEISTQHSISLEEAQDILEEQTKELIELNTAKEREFSILNELVWENHKLEDELRPLSQEISQLQEEISSKGDANKPLDPKLEKMAHWYMEARSILEKATGMTVRRLTEGIIEIEYKDVVHETSIGQLSIVMIPSTKRLIDAKAYYRHGILVPVDDLLQYTLKHEDLRFLIMETMFRLRNYHLRQKEFDEIIRFDHDLKFESSTRGLDIRVRNLDSGDQFDFFVDHAYPLDSRSFSLKNVLYAASRWDLSSCQAKLHQSGASTLSDALIVLETM